MDVIKQSSKTQRNVYFPSRQQRFGRSESDAEWFPTEEKDEKEEERGMESSCTTAMTACARMVTTRQMANGNARKSRS